MHPLRCSRRHHNTPNAVVATTGRCCNKPLQTIKWVESHTTLTNNSTSHQAQTTCSTSYMQSLRATFAT